MTAPRPADVAEALAGAGAIALALITPFLRSRRMLIGIRRRAERSATRTPRAVAA